MLSLENPSKGGNWSKSAKKESNTEKIKMSTLRCLRELNKNLSTVPKLRNSVRRESTQSKTERNKSMQRENGLKRSSFYGFDRTWRLILGIDSKNRGEPVWRKIEAIGNEKNIEKSKILPKNTELCEMKKTLYINHKNLEEKLSLLERRSSTSKKISNEKYTQENKKEKENIEIFRISSLHRECNKVDKTEFLKEMRPKYSFSNKKVEEIPIILRSRSSLENQFPKSAELILNDTNIINTGKWRNRKYANESKEINENKNLERKENNVKFQIIENKIQNIGIQGQILDNLDKDLDFKCQPWSRNNIETEIEI